MRFCLLAVSVLLPSTLQAQYQHGSVAVLQAAGDYIVIAADSLRVGPRPGQVSYKACKIVQLSDQLVYTQAGISSKEYIEGPGFLASWKTADIAKQEYDYLAQKHEPRLIENVAAAYGKNLAAKINHDLSIDPQGKVRSFLSANGGVGRAIFAGFDEKQQRTIIEVNVAFSSPNAREVDSSIAVRPGNDDTIAQIVGDTSVAEEYAAGRTERSRRWRSALEFANAGLGLQEQLIRGARRIAQLTAQYDPNVVGGPIDVVLVTRKLGVTWVRRKPVCGTFPEARR